MSRFASHTGPAGAVRKLRWLAALSAMALLAACGGGGGDSPAALQTTGQMVFDGSAPTIDLSAQWRNLQWPLRGKAIVTSSSGDGT